MSRVRAPGLIRGGVFFVIGVLFAAALVLLIRGLYGYPSFDDGMTTKAQDAILLA